MKLLYDFYRFKRVTALLNVRMYFDNNSAVEAGADLYGGSIDNCALNSFEFDEGYFGYHLSTGYTTLLDCSTQFTSVAELLKVNTIAELLTLIFKLYTLSYIFCNCTYVFTGTHAIFCN